MKEIQGINGETYLNVKVPSEHRDMLITHEEFQRKWTRTAKILEKEMGGEMFPWMVRAAELIRKRPEIAEHFYGIMNEVICWDREKREGESGL